MLDNDITGILDGKEEIREYLKGAGDRKLRAWVELGMPVLIDGAGRWLAHKDNIENFFRKITNNKVTIIPDENE